MIHTDKTRHRSDVSVQPSKTLIHIECDILSMHTISYTSFYNRQNCITPSVPNYESQFHKSNNLSIILKFRRHPSFIKNSRLGWFIAMIVVLQ